MLCFESVTVTRLLSLMPGLQLSVLLLTPRSDLKMGSGRTARVTLSQPEGGNTLSSANEKAGTPAQSQHIDGDIGG